MAANFSSKRGGQKGALTFSKKPQQGGKRAFFCLLTEVKFGKGINPKLFFFPLLMFLPLNYLGFLGHGGAGGCMGLGIGVAFLSFFEGKFFFSIFSVS